MGAAETMQGQLAVLPRDPTTALWLLPRHRCPVL